MKLRLDQLELNQQNDATPPVFPWMAEYSKLKIIVWWAERAADENLPSLNLLFPDKRLAYLSVDSPCVRACRTRLGQIQRQHISPGHPLENLNSPEFADAFIMLRDAMVQQLQKQVEQHCREHWLLNHYVQKLSGRPKEQKKVLSNLAKSRTKINDGLQQLKAWATGSFFNKPPAATAARDWGLDSMLQLQFPWEAVLGDGSGNGQNENALLMKLLHHRQEYQRAKEELAIIEREKASLLRLHEAQCQAMEAHVQQLQQKIVAGKQQLSEPGDMEDATSEQLQDGALQALRHRAAMQQEIRHLEGACALIGLRMEFVRTVLCNAQHLFGMQGASTASGAAEPNIEFESVGGWHAMDGVEYTSDDSDADC